jgi:hypothetical protein
MHWKELFAVLPDAKTLHEMTGWSVSNPDGLGPWLRPFDWFAAPGAEAALFKDDEYIVLYVAVSEVENEPGELRDTVMRIIREKLAKAGILQDKP